MALADDLAQIEQELRRLLIILQGLRQQATLAESQRLSVAPPPPRMERIK